MINRDFFAELKRRNLYKVAVADAVVSWDGLGRTEEVARTPGPKS